MKGEKLDIWNKEKCGSSNTLKKKKKSMKLGKQF